MAALSILTVALLLIETKEENNEPKLSMTRSVHQAACFLLVILLSQQQRTVFGASSTNMVLRVSVYPQIVILVGPKDMAMLNLRILKVQKRLLKHRRVLKSMVD